VKHFYNQFRIPNTANVNQSVDRRSALAARLALATLLIIVVYIGIDCLIDIEADYILFGSIAICCTGTLVINGFGYHRTAKIAGMLAFNILIYGINSSEPYSTAFHLHQITMGFVAMIIFGFEEKGWGILFGLLSATLYILSYFGSYSWLEYRHFSEGQIRLLFVINCIIFLVLCGYILLEVLSLSFHAERKLTVQNDELLKTNKELDRFVYSASHDLRAPLRSLLGLIEISQKTNDPEDIKQCLDLMKQRVDNMDGFIREIIDFSRNARQEVRQEIFLLLPVVKEIVEDLKFAEGMDKIYVRFDISPTQEIITDLSRFKVVLQNLIGNAFKYHDAAKEQQEVFIKSTPEDSKIRIDIEDNGLGIGEEHQVKIFEMFYRASEKAHGSGLGLYIVKETITKLKGSIQLKSTEGKGSQFTIWLPG
jgi:signal transduction histidine kinase